jgi:formylglycine-generating enzyme required for sulfatase activity
MKNKSKDAIHRVSKITKAITICIALAYTVLSAQSKGFTDTVILKNGKVLEGVKATVTKDSLVVTNPEGETSVFTKKDVSEVKKGGGAQPTKEPDTTGNPVTNIKAGETFTSQTGIELMSIPAGEFMMGCSEGDNECSATEKPAHKVKLTRGFYIGKYEVTQGQWKAVMGKELSFWQSQSSVNPSKFKDCGDDCPVEKVSWNDVKEFLVKLNAQEGRTGARMFRLPTEAEWEYAARGGTKTKFYANDLASIAWYSANSGDTTHPVGKKTPNAFGLYDMLGNVWEWTEDWYGDTYYSVSKKTDPIGPSSGSYRVLRGGSWWYWSGSESLSYRFSSSPDFRNRDFGFRVVVLP